MVVCFLLLIEHYVSETVVYIAVPFQKNISLMLKFTLENPRKESMYMAGGLTVKPLFMYIRGQ